MPHRLTTGYLSGVAQQSSNRWGGAPPPPRRATYYVLLCELQDMWPTGADLWSCHQALHSSATATSHVQKLLFRHAGGVSDFRHGFDRPAVRASICPFFLSRIIVTAIVTSCQRADSRYLVLEAFVPAAVALVHRFSQNIPSISSLSLFRCFQKAASAFHM